MTRAPERLETARLLLRRPAAADAEAIFARYASNAEVVRYVGWPRHSVVDDTRAFLAFSDAEWERRAAGPYLILDRRSGELLGGTGLAFETADSAQTGYVLARDAWGRGCATEALGAMVALARSLGVRRLYAFCHADHAASARVLEKGGFTQEARLRRHAEFPNLVDAGPQDVLRYAAIL